MNDEEESVDDLAISKKTTVTVGLVIGLLACLGATTAFLDNRIASGEERLIDNMKETAKHVTELRIAMERLEGATDANRQLVKQKHETLEKTIEDLAARIRALEDK